MNLGDEKRLKTLVEKILASGSPAGERRLVCLAGPPASGKSTLAERLAELLTLQGSPAQVVPMDGFHLHNQILMERGLLARKGAPETFDVLGLLSLVARLRDKTEVIFPTFDRERDIAIAGSGIIDEQCDTVIVEGNYLLMELPFWRELREFWDLSIFLEVPEAVLTERLINRWLVHGLSPEEAERRAKQNDLVNAKLICDGTGEADVTFCNID
jgi:fructokinase